jgi:nucleoside-diphosphate kinase
MERTLAIIKPDAVRRRLVGAILSRVEQEGFTILAMRLQHLTKDEAKGFYEVHRERPFFASLTDYMSSGPCVPMVLEKENAIFAWREVMGATNPEDAEEGTIRKQFGESLEHNSAHGSDAPETANFEINYFFVDSKLA